MAKSQEQIKLDDEESERRITELAIQTRNWAHRMGAFRDPKTGHHGYFKIEEWTDFFNESKRLFKRVKARLVTLGEPISRDDFNGHYWGNQGEQMTNVATSLKHIYTLMETVGVLMEAARNSGQMDACLEDLEKRLEGNRHNIKVSDVPKLLSGAGMPLGENTERRFLPDLFSIAEEDSPN